VPSEVFIDGSLRLVEITLEVVPVFLKGQPPKLKILFISWQRNLFRSLHRQIFPPPAREYTQKQTQDIESPDQNVYYRAQRGADEAFPPLPQAFRGHKGTVLTGGVST
jgi:hypothetical protein